MSRSIKLEIAGKTDIGKARAHNEDAILWDESLGFIVLADGMGGHNAGDVASRMAVENLLKYIGNHPPTTRGNNNKQMVRDAVGAVNLQIFHASQEDADFANMGTTITAMLCFENKAVLAHVGDSRIYRMRKNRFEAMTRDHSLVNQLIDQGNMSEEEARISQYRNVLTRALGTQESVDVAIREIGLEPGDLFLLCSDGLYNMIPETEVCQMLADVKGNLESTAQTLIDRANHYGGNDNISVIIVACS